MNFGILDNSCMFATRTPNSQANLNEGYFYGLMSAIILSDIRLLLSPWIAFVRLRLEFGDLGKGSLSLFNNFKFHTGMPNSNEHLKDGAKSVLSSTPDSAKTVSQPKSQLQKLLQSALKKADEKEAENKRLKAELYHKLFYLARNQNFSFSMFEKNNPVDKCDWKKLYDAEMKLREAEE